MHGGAISSQRRSQHVAAIVVVIDQENGDVVQFQRAIEAAGRARSYVETASVPGILIGKRRAAILAGTVDGDAAAVQLDDLPREREAEPEPAVPAARRRIGLAEPVEDVGQKIRRDALAGVARRSARRRVLLRVSRTSIRPPARVNFTAFDSTFQIACCSRSGVAVDERQAVVEIARAIAICLAAAAGATTSMRGLHDVADVDRLHLEPQLAADDARHVEQVLDQPAAAPRRCAR